MTNIEYSQKEFLSFDTKIKIMNYSVEDKTLEKSKPILTILPLLKVIIKIEAPKVVQTRT